MKNPIRLSVGISLAAATVFAVSAWGQAAAPKLSWAFPNPDKNPPPAEPQDVPKHLPGSTKAYTQKQIDDQFAPPDWYPNEHAPLPNLVQTGVQAQACGSCHLMSGNGHPESASIAGLPVEYMIRQMQDFKTGARKDAPGYEDTVRAGRMAVIANGIPDDKMRAAVAYFAALKPAVWYKVEEADTVPKSWLNGGRMRLPLPGGGTEPLGNRIITLPQDPERIEERDPHTGFIAYVPKGSIKKGEELVTKGGNGKTIACATCHGEGLKGLGDIPHLAGIHPIYLVRQMTDFKTGSNSSTMGAPMKKVVENLSDDDMIAIAAYIAGLPPQ